MYAIVKHNDEEETVLATGRLFDTEGDAAIYMAENDLCSRWHWVKEFIPLNDDIMGETD